MCRKAIIQSIQNTRSLGYIIYIYIMLFDKAKTSHLSPNDFTGVRFASLSAIRSRCSSRNVSSPVSPYTAHTIRVLEVDAWRAIKSFTYLQEIITLLRDYVKVYVPIRYLQTAEVILLSYTQTKSYSGIACFPFCDTRSMERTVTLSNKR